MNVIVRSLDSVDDKIMAPNLLEWLLNLTWVGSNLVWAIGSINSHICPQLTFADKIFRLIWPGKVFKR